MTLNNFYFLFFWMGSLVLLACVQGLGGKIQKGLLVALSYIFVALSDIRFLIAILLTTCVIYGLGRLIGSPKIHNKRLWLIVGIIYLIGILLYFKYTKFFLLEFAQLWGIEPKTIRIVMPLGLSYYTFSCITYLVDLYRGNIIVERNIIDFALFIGFFPKITAGPIVKAREFLPQLKNYTGINWSNIEAGAQIFVFGLFKKIVLADHLGVFVDDVFWSPSAYHSATIALAAISYSLQIYLDFSGYSDMAIGVARTFGIDIPANFNMPYIASNISEFWKRWHISLSSFLQEYVYYPLGGNRKGNVRTYVNLMLVMIISGLWHGDGATFLMWGILHGIASCLHRGCKRIVPNGRISAVIGVGWNFIIVTIFWIFFRATDLQNAFAVLKGIFVYQDGIHQPYLWSFFAIVVCVLASVIACRKGRNGYYPILKLSSVKSWTIFFVFIGMTIMLGYFGNTAFIYGGF